MFLCAFRISNKKEENKNVKQKCAQTATCYHFRTLNIYTRGRNFLKRHAPSYCPRSNHSKRKWAKWSTTELFIIPTASHAKYQFVRWILPNKSTYRQQWSLDRRICHVPLQPSWRHKHLHQHNRHRSRQQHIHIRYGQQWHPL